MSIMEFLFKLKSKLQISLKIQIWLHLLKKLCCLRNVNNYKVYKFKENVFINISLYLHQKYIVYIITNFQNFKDVKKIR